MQQDVNAEKGNQSRIGYYQYSTFNSAYGSSQYLTFYKIEYLWLILNILFFVLAFAFLPLPAFNKVIDSLTVSKRASFSIYWFPAVFYFIFSIFSLSDFVNWTKKKISIFFGVITILWHIIFIILFWAYESKMYGQSSRSDRSLSVGWYLTEICINIITVIIQCCAGRENKDHISTINQKVDKIKKDVNKFLNVWDLLPNPEIYIKTDQDHHDHEEEPLKNDDSQPRNSQDHEDRMNSHVDE